MIYRVAKIESDYFFLNFIMNKNMHFIAIEAINKTLRIIIMQMMLFILKMHIEKEFL